MLSNRYGAETNVSIVRNDQGEVIQSNIKPAPPAEKPNLDISVRYPCRAYLSNGKFYTVQITEATTAGQFTAIFAAEMAKARVPSPLLIICLPHLQDRSHPC